MPTSVLIPVVLTSSRASLDPGPQVAQLSKLLWDCQEWWSNAGVYICFAGFHALLNQNIDLAQDNPWSDVLALMQREYPPDALYVVLAPEWDNPEGFVGWGGPPLALCGKWVWDRLIEAGNPAAEWDNENAARVILHEVGHTLGLPHDFTTPAALMGYDLDGFDVVLTQRPGTVNGGLLACQIGKGTGA